MCERNDKMCWHGSGHCSFHIDGDNSFKETCVDIFYLKLFLRTHLCVNLKKSERNGTLLWVNSSDNIFGPTFNTEFSVWKLNKKFRRVIIYGRSKGLFMELETVIFYNVTTVKPLSIVLVCVILIQISPISSGPEKPIT